MSDQLGSPYFRALFEAALQDYEQKTKVSLANHPLAEKLRNIHSVESVVALLQSEARTFGEFRGRDKIMKSIKNTVLILCKIFAITTLGDALGLVRRKVLIMLFHISETRSTGFETCRSNIYWPRCATLCMCLFKFLRLYCHDIRVHQEAVGVIDSYDVLVDLLESIEQLLKRLDIYTMIPRASASAMGGMAVKIMMELISALALATKEVKQGQLSEFIVSDVLRYSVQRREVWKKAFWGNGRRGRPTKARSSAH